MNVVLLCKYDCELLSSIVNCRTRGLKTTTKMIGYGVHLGEENEWQGNNELMMSVILVPRVLIKEKEL